MFRNVLISPSQGEPLACLLQPPGRRIAAIRVNDAGTLLAVTLVGKNGRELANKLYRLTASAASGFTCQEIKTPSGIYFPLPWFRPDSEEIITVSEKNEIVSWVFNPKSRDTPELVPSRTILAQNALSDTLGPIETTAFDASGSTLLLSDFSGKMYLAKFDGKRWSFTQKKTIRFYPPSLGCQW